MGLCIFLISSQKRKPIFRSCQELLFLTIFFVNLGKLYFNLCDKAKVMVEIIIRRRIVTEKIATKLKNIASCVPEGSCIPVALPNGDFTFDVTEDIKTYWNSLNVSQQMSIIKTYIEGNWGLEEVIKEEMNKP